MSVRKCLPSRSILRRFMSALLLAISLILLAGAAVKSPVHAQPAGTYQLFFPMIELFRKPDFPPICEWEPQDQCIPTQP